MWPECSKLSEWNKGQRNEGKCIIHTTEIDDHQVHNIQYRSVSHNVPNVLWPLGHSCFYLLSAQCLLSSQILLHVHTPKYTGKHTHNCIGNNPVHRHVAPSWKSQRMPLVLLLWHWWLCTCLNRFSIADETFCNNRDIIILMLAFLKLLGTYNFTQVLREKQYSRF